MTIEERKNIALTSHKQGYNCAQSVLAAFSDVLPMDKDTLMKISAALGAGIGVGEVCGVVSAMGIARGITTDSARPEAKITAMKLAASDARDFKTANGAIRCADLKRNPGAKPCDLLIANGVEILASKLNLNDAQS